jgi:uncharacterized protein
MKFKTLGSKYLVKLEKDEEIIASLTQFCKEQNISAGTISAIGAFNKATIGWYELSSKSYHWLDFSGNLEVISLTGNVALLENEPMLHIHCVISNEQLQCFGGHLKEGVVGVTLEVVIEKLEGEIERKMDEEIGLNLLDL